jgi:DNA-binding MarR family transcriptional regulator
MTVQKGRNARPRSPVGSKPAVAPHRSDYPAHESLGLLLRIATHGLRSMFKKPLDRAEIPLSTWYCLRVLWENEGISQRELTRRVGLMQPNAVNALRSMQERGLVVIERETADRRKTRIYLTAKARRLKEELLPATNDLLEAVALKGFTSDESAELKRLLNKLCRNVEEHTGNAVPGTG